MNDAVHIKKKGGMYYFHVHDLTVSNKVIKYNKNKPGELTYPYADNYIHSSSGGCFTTPVANTGYVNMCAGSGGSPVAWSGGPGNWRHPCPTCGATWTSGAQGQPPAQSFPMHTVGSTSLNTYTYYTYSRSCGLLNGTRMKSDGIRTWR